MESICIKHSNGKHYRLKQGYKVRLLPGSQIVSTLLAEDFLSEGKRPPGQFEIATSLVLSATDYALSTASVVSKDPEQDVTVTEIEVCIQYTSNLPVYQNQHVPVLAQYTELLQGLPVVYVEGVTVGADTDTVDIKTNYPDLTVSLDISYARVNEIERGKVLLLVNEQHPAVMSIEEFERYFLVTKCVNSVPRGYPSRAATEQTVANSI